MIIRSQLPVIKLIKKYLRGENKLNRKEKLLEMCIVGDSTGEKTCPSISPRYAGAGDTRHTFLGRLVTLIVVFLKNDLVIDAH